MSDQRALKEEKINEFEQGLRPDGSKIGTYRDAEYAIFKQSINPRAGGDVDLLLSRRTANSMFVRKGQSDRGYIFGITDTHNLIGRYGQDILGIDQDWFNKRQKEIYRITLVFQIKKNYNIA